ncbi:MAG: hypothetical protein NC113_04925 [Bacteroides sp.]|nr:hypothetical protein [Bacteroides sp.]MCM1447551.1 hypothetical protein [Bacteroides sp.]
MKKISHFCLSALVLGGLLTVTSCSEEDYEMAKISGMQVYMDANTAQTIELDADATTFSIPVMRVDATEEASIPVSVEMKDGLKVTCDAPLVNFAVGEKNTELVFSYNPDDFNRQDMYDVYAELVVTLDNRYTSEYGLSTQTFRVGMAAPWTPWCNSRQQWVEAGQDADTWPLGDAAPATCTYTYTQIFNGDDADLPVFYRLNKAQPTQAEIRIDNWGYGVSLVLSYDPTVGNERSNIVISKQFTGYTDSGVGDFYITDVTGWQGADLYARFPNTFNTTTGRVVLNTAWMANTDAASCYGYGEEYIQFAGFYVPDYTVNVLFEGILTDADQVPYVFVNTKFGTDVETVKAFVASKEDDAAAVADAIAAGDVESVEIVEGANKVALNDATGELQLVVVSMADGEVKDVQSVGFEYYGGGANPWQSLGTGLWRESVVCTLFNVPGEDILCEIQENSEKPGLYRLVKPYANWSLAGENASTPTDIVVNACDPEGVYLEAQLIGVNLDGNELGLMSEGARYMSAYDFETIKANGLFGTCKDGVITLPTFHKDSEDGGYDYQGLVLYGSMTNGYYGVENFRVVLPEALSESAARAASFSTRLRGNAGVMKAHADARKANGKAANKHMLRKMNAVTL